MMLIVGGWPNKASGEFPLCKKIKNPISITTKTKPMITIKRKISGPACLRFMGAIPLYFFFAIWIVFYTIVQKNLAFAKQLQGFKLVQNIEN